MIKSRYFRQIRNHLRSRIDIRERKKISFILFKNRLCISTFSLILMSMIKFIQNNKYCTASSLGGSCSLNVRFHQLIKREASQLSTEGLTFKSHSIIYILIIFFFN